MLNPFQKLFSKSDVKKSADLAELLVEHLETRPAVEASCKPLYAEARELTIQLNAAKEYGDPELPALQEQQQAILTRIRTKKYVFDQECSRLQNALERLNRPAIRAFQDQCQAWMEQAHQGRKLNVLERRLDPTSDKERWLARVSDNLGVVRQAKTYIGQAQSEIASMQHKPLAMIKEKIAEVTANVERFDFDKLQSDDEWVSASLIADFQAESVAPVNQKFDVGFLTAAPSPKTSGGWKVVRVGE